MNPVGKTLKDNWFSTFTGKKFHPFDPHPEEICLEDIAHHLALQCRYNGACRAFYSVAQHSILVANLVAPEHKQWGLLHDAAEAYIGDMVRPLKLGLPIYKEVERKIEAVIAEVFGLPPEMPPAVKVADNIMLYAERRDLLEHKHPWSLQDEMKPLITEVRQIIPYTPETSERAFIGAARKLHLS